MGLYKSSIRITRGKSFAKEVASIAKESACALPLLEHVGDLRAIFEVLRKYKLCLNAYKCSFGVGSGKFLGYIVTHRGIEVNPDQIKANRNGCHLQSPRNSKEVQKLTGMAATLNRFISRSADRCRPFFLLINKWKDFE